MIFFKGIINEAFDGFGQYWTVAQGELSLRGGFMEYVP